MTAESKTIIITVSATGETKIEAKGFSGTSCRDATRTLEQALGVIASDKATAEMYQTESAKAQQQQSG